MGGPSFRDVTAGKVTTIRVSRANRVKHCFSRRFSGIENPLQENPALHRQQLARNVTARNRAGPPNSRAASMRGPYMTSTLPDTAVAAKFLCTGPTVYASGKEGAGLFVNAL